MSKEGETYSKQINSFITERIKEIQIDDIDVMSDDRLQNSVARGARQTPAEKEKECHMCTNSNKETVQTDDKLQASQSAV